MKVFVLGNSSDAFVELCGIAMIERTLRVLQRLGVAEVSIVDANAAVGAALSKPSWARAELKLDFVNNLLSSDELTLVIPGGSYCDLRLLTGLLKRTKPTLLIDSNPPNEWLPLLAKAERLPAGFVCGPEIRGGAEELLDVAALDPYSDLLRRVLHPLWFPPPAQERIAQAERLILDSTQKGILDVTARLHWPFENFIVRRLWRTRITPNQVTWSSTLFGCLGTIAFARGAWWWGFVIARIFAILDGVDGKLARVKVETTKVGKGEHYSDAALEYSWWLTLAYSLGAANQLQHGWIYAAFIIAGDLLGKLANALVAAHTGRPSHRGSEFERYFRLIGGRRDIYTAMLLIGLLVRQPGHAFAFAGWWSLISLAIQAVRTVYVCFGTPRLAR
ncbi:MAG: CDP-alcohol phosphatidyltransferase family protein [Verrucomicrobia bacterium]|nr:CDP-alcohol phosphatidyltransferase family protein [Verrucomicrobiota bacterium]